MDLYHQDHLYQRHHKISFTAALLHLNQSDPGRDAVRRTDRDQIGNSLWINSNDSLSISGQSPGLIFGQYLDNSFNICPDWTEATVTYLWWRFASCVSSDCQQGHDATGWDDKTSEANRWTAQKTFVIKVPLMSSPQQGPHGAPEFPSLARGAGGDSRHLIEIWDHRYRSTYSPCNLTSLLLSLNQSLKFVFVSSILNLHFH